LEVIDFPEVVKDKITICKKTEVHYDIDEEEKIEDMSITRVKITNEGKERKSQTAACL